MASDEGHGEDFPDGPYSDIGSSASQPLPTKMLCGKFVTGNFAKDNEGMRRMASGNSEAMEFVIERGIPLPPPRAIGVPGRWSKIAEEMEPLDSVVVKTDGQVQSLRTAAAKLNKKIASKKLEEGEEGAPGYRVWIKG